MRIINGILTEDESIQLDSGYSSGSGFFETIHVTDKPILLAAHLDRLNRSLEQFEIDKIIYDKDVYHAIDLLQVSNEALKIMVSEGNTIFEKRTIPYHPERYDTGVAIKMSSFRRMNDAPFVSHKSLNYAENALALKEARDNGFFDSYFINDKGHVTETSLANIFIINEGQIMTPKLEGGLLPGTIRQWLIEHYEVLEINLTIQDIQAAEGIFLTNSLMGILWVANIDGIDKTKCDLSQSLLASYRSEMGIEY